MFEKIVWEYNLSEDEFKDILSGKTSRGWFDQDWALTRCINNLNYYDLIALVPRSLIKSRWEIIKDRITVREIRDGLSFFLQRYPLPPTE